MKIYTFGGLLNNDFSNLVNKRAELIQTFRILFRINQLETFGVCYKNK